MTAEERRKRIKEYGQGPALLARALRRFPRKMWKFKPAPNRWSIHEILVHLADSETNAYLRARRFLAEPGQNVLAYDQDVWAQKLDYHRQDTRDALALVRLVRKLTYALLRRAPDAAWEARCTHPEHPDYSFERWLEIYSGHIPGHIRQMEKNFAAWKARQQ